MRLFVALALWTTAERQGRLMPVGALPGTSPRHPTTATT
jgi:hypothetical protein